MALGFLKALLFFFIFFSYPQSPVNTIFFPEDLTLSLESGQQNERQKGERMFFQEWLLAQRSSTGERRKALEKGGSEQAPKFSPFDLPRKAGEIWGFLWDTILSHAKPSAWQRGLAQGSWLGGRLIR